MTANPQLDYRLHFQAGDTIFREGDKADTMYFVRSGSVQILKRLAGVEQEVNRMEAGDFFGEIAILKELPRGATARALTEVELSEIRRYQFEALLALDIEIPIRIMRGLSDALGVAQMRLDEALSRLGPDERREVEAAVQAKVSASGAGRVLARLSLMGGEQEQQWVIDSAEVRIGRRDGVTGIVPEVDLGSVPDKESVSRLHARLGIDEAGAWLAEEVGVRNGTQVNGVRLEPGVPFRLKDGDLISVGMASLLLSLEAADRESGQAEQGASG